MARGDPFSGGVDIHEIRVEPQKEYGGASKGFGAYTGGIE